ncbi:EAL domain-containing protein [Oceanobacillus bengalensis]|uniref:EAL domain-containing protein n=2 Tax=Oceanobacillus bengalensis TaxID=1435466 RepID=A0A494YT57_9BACI|nr:EAL domain-containing protein [Oceanobacillus bengalensis]RKQ13315.1 EAL domain-containing protein [Oceanobacillus bengalensis]
MIQAAFNPLLAIFSVFIAVISSYTTLVLVERIFDGKRSRKMSWIISGTLVMGTGIFSMHFIAIIAFHVDSPMTYNVSLLFLSYLSALLSAFAAFYILYADPLTKAKIVLSGVMIGIGIILLHYIATFATHEPVQIQYQSIYFFLSIFISIVFSIISIVLFAKMKEGPHISNVNKGLVAIVLGLTISIMHFAGIKATHFPEQNHDHSLNNEIDTFTLGILLSCSTLIIMIIALFTAFHDYRALKKSKRLFNQIKESEERYRHLVELSPQPIVVHDGQEILFVNEICLKIIHATNKDELIGKSIIEFILPQYRAVVEDRIQKLQNGEQVKSMELQIMTFKASIIDVEIAGIGIRYDNKAAFQLVLRDITEQKKVKRELAEQKQRYRSLFEYNPDLVFSMNPQGHYTEFNSTVWDMLGYSKDDSLQMSYHDVVDSKYLDITNENFKKALEGKPQKYEIEIIAKNGERIPINVTNIPIIVEGMVSGVFGIAKDMSKEKAALKKIEELAYTDQLTGLPNRTWFYNYISEVVEKTKVHQQTIAILSIDFDNFKNVNDTLGHNIGDLFLRRVSERLIKCLRKHDKIARIGGDEFIIILEDVTEEEAIQLAKLILKVMNQTMNLFGHEIVVTLSIGISIHSDFKLDLESMIKQADLAMYLAKEQRKNNYQLFTKELNEKVTRRLKLERSLRKAIKQKELKLYYQPQVDIQTGKLLGIEALLRWNPSFGFVSPNEFIPIAEETGLIVQIGEWVMNEACRKIKQWEKHELLNVPISINVSVRQFRDSNFVRKVKEIISKEKINPKFLEIEITERVMFNVEESSESIKDLREFGIMVAIDDFGVGYSSLYLIANLDYDTLKIDKSLIDDLLNNERKMAILSAIIDATNNHKRIIIEGIETKEQVEVLKNFSVIGQGYFFSHPLPAKELELKVKQIGR